MHGSLDGTAGFSGRKPSAGQAQGNYKRDWNALHVPTQFLLADQGIA